MIYLDYAASSPVDPEIIDTYAELLHKYFANAASLHKMGAQTDSLQIRARDTIAKAINVNPEEIIFTSGSTESNNLSIKGVAFQYANRGKHIITTIAEHPSVIKTCQQLHDQFGFEITYLPINKDGIVSLNDLKQAIRTDTILVSVMFVNNETGAINPISEIGAYLRANYPNIFFHTDATQGFGKLPIDLTNVDLMSMSAHKIYGLKGSGFMLKRKRVNLTPLIVGGSHEMGLRAGTSNWPVNVMLAKTVRKALDEQSNNYAKVLKFNLQVRNAAKTIEGIVINSPDIASPYVLNLSFPNKKSAIIAAFFEQEDICVSTVSACSSKKERPSYVIDAMYHDDTRSFSSIRISFGKYTTEEEVKRLIEVLKLAPSATL